MSSPDFRRRLARPACERYASQAMAETGKIAKNLERFAQAVAAHDRENPTHTAHGIGLAHFDMERLGFEEGEEILPGITIHADSGVTGNFRVLCDGQHDEDLTEAEEQAVEAIATQAIPAGAPGASPFRELRVARGLELMAEDDAQFGPVSAQVRAQVAAEWPADA
jgi:hypothetical protein